MSQTGDSPTPLRAVRTRPADRRTEIIAAAIKVIARDGIRACTISALEHETRFARGHFTYHFQSKEEIINLAFATVTSDWAMTQMQATVSDAGTAPARLEHHVRTAVHWAQTHPEYFRCLMNFRVEIMRNAGAFPPASIIRHQLWGFAAQMIRDGIVEGRFRPQLDPTTEGRAIFAMVDGFLMHAAMDPEFCPAGELADRVWNLIVTRLAAAPPLTE